MNSPLQPNLIWVKMCDWYHLSMSRKSINIFSNLRWPRDQWPLLLHSVLKGKAQEAYTALPIFECVDYAILKAYELVPEAYRQKFRENKKGN